MKMTIEKLPRHESQRGYFAYELHEQMEANKDIYVLTGDLGFGMLDRIRDDFRDRFVNCGASEQAMMGMAVGLALEGKIPIVYSITPFLLYRPFETIRNYINHEQIAVKLVGGGRDKDYTHDGFSHWAEEASQVLSVLPNITQMWPETKEDVIELTRVMLYNGQPSFLSLKR